MPAFVARSASIQSHYASALRLVIVVLAWTAFTPPANAACQPPAVSRVPRLAGVDSLAAAEFAQDSVGSITIGVVSGSDLVWTKSYGFADMATRRLANRQTVYRIGSITKMFTGVMLQQLLERGVIRLSDPISRFLPEIKTVHGLPSSATVPTILQLATMTGGLAAEPDSQILYGTGPVSEWESKTISALGHTRYAYAPGTRFSYSNIGYAALGVALERAAGSSYLRWQKERILDPLQMRRTRFDLDPTVANDLATGYEVGNDGKVSTEGPARELRTGRGYRLPIGCIFTTVDDLSRFLSFELGHGPEGVLPHARLDSAYAGIVATSVDMDVGYGLGFMAQRRGEFTWLGHSGGVPGYTAMMYYDREWQLGVIVFRNATGGKARIGRLAIDALQMLILARIEAEKAARGSG